MSFETSPAKDVLHHRWHWLPICLVAAGVLAICLVAAANYRVLGWWQLPIYVGGAIALAGAVWFRRKLTVAEVELDDARHQLSEETSRLAEERGQFLQLQREVEKQFAEQASRLDKRERDLADRFVSYHEWMEFPQPIDLNEAQIGKQSADYPSPATASLLPDLSDERVAELTKKDRQMMELLKAETKILYDNITSNKYVENSKFQPALLRDDAYDLIRRVARIYQPEANQPLLETNLPLVIRACSRACLHFLVIIDELPLNVQEYSFNSLYSYVRSAVNAYRMYKSTEPYWPYVNTAYYLGRFAMGASPITLGAWWFLGAIGKQGAQAIATRIINRQALALLSDVVRVIGYEVASIYGGDFRHRDANWIYGAELTELLHQFPLSREGLSHALKEIGALQLRSEYDRVFLYRCAAAHASAHPQNYRAMACLTMAECRAIATRLERFQTTHIHGKTADRLQKWKSAVEGRLGVKLFVKLQPTATSVRVQLEDAVRSLAGFLLGSKECEPPELPALLASSQVMSELPPEDRSKLLARLQEDPPYFFEHPDIDPESDLVAKYLADLAALQVRIAPRDAALDEAVIDVAQYLRHDAKRMQRTLAREYVQVAMERVSTSSPTRRVSSEVARALLDLLESGEQARFLYSSITLDWPPGTAGPSYNKNALWLVGAGRRIVLFAVDEDEATVLWRGDGPLRLETDRGLLATSCKLTGGLWLADSGLSPPVIRIGGALVSPFASYFRPLQAFVEESKAAVAQA